MNFAFQPRGLSKFHNECGYKGGDLVSVEHVEVAMIVQIVIHEPVGVPVKTAAAFIGRGL